MSAAIDRHWLTILPECRTGVYPQDTDRTPASGGVTPTQRPAQRGPRATRTRLLVWVRHIVTVACCSGLVIYLLALFAAYFNLI